MQNISKSYPKKLYEKSTTFEEKLWSFLNWKEIENRLQETSLAHLFLSFESSVVRLICQAWNCPESHLLKTSLFLTAWQHLFVYGRILFLSLWLQHLLHQVCHLRNHLLRPQDICHREESWSCLWCCASSCLPWSSSCLPLLVLKPSWEPTPQTLFHAVRHFNNSCNFQKRNCLALLSKFEQILLFFILVDWFHS